MGDSRLEMRVVFALRSDALTKPGGDSSKVHRYRSHLAALGWDSSIVTSPQDLAKERADVVHIVNLDLPIENSGYVRVANRMGAPIALSTIRHPFDGVEAMYHHGADSFYKSTRRLLLSADQAVAARERIKLFRAKNPSWRLGGSSFFRNQHRLIGSVDAYLPMAEGERLDLERLFRPPGQCSVVRNGFTFGGLKTAEEAFADPTFDVISVGRIEPRKNSVALARAALQLGVTVKFVGALNTKHRAYAMEFERLVESSSAIVHQPAVPQDELPKILAQATTYVNPAWFEVVSQADAEAATLGLKIVTTKHSYIQDALGPSTPVFDPTDLIATPADALAAALGKATTVSPPAPIQWSDAVADLVRAYEGIVRR